MVAEILLEETEFEFTVHFSADPFSVNAFVVDRVTSPLPNFHLKGPIGLISNGYSLQTLISSYKAP